MGRRRVTLNRVNGEGLTRKVTLEQRFETERIIHIMIGEWGTGTWWEGRGMQGSDLFRRNEKQVQKLEVVPFLAGFINKRPEQGGQWG